MCIRDSPYADQGLNRIPDTVSDEQALFVGDVLATGFWATRISEISEDDTVPVSYTHLDVYKRQALGDC